MAIPLQSFIDCISDELLEEILCRLPCPACIARAAAVSTRFRGIIFRPGFLRRISSHHPFPLPGFFFDAGYDAFPLTYYPRFTPFGPYCGGEFPLEDLPRDRKWSLCDCRGGRLLFFSRTAPEALFVVCDPVGRRFLTLPALPKHFSLPLFGARVAADPNADSLYSQVICVADGIVYVNRAGETGWDEQPDPRWSGEPQSNSDGLLLSKNTILLPRVIGDHLLAFDVTAGEILTAKFLIMRRYEDMRLVELEDERTICIVALSQLEDCPEDAELHLWKLEKCGWVLSVIPLRSVRGAEELLHSKLGIMDANSGFLFLKRDSRDIFAIRLKTKQSFKLRVLPPQYRIYGVFPFWMPWLCEQ